MHGAQRKPTPHASRSGQQPRVHQRLPAADRSGSAVLQVKFIDCGLGTSAARVSMSRTKHSLPLSRIRVSHVLNDTHMKFSLPSSRKEMKDVCIQFDGGNCASVGSLSYIALPHCSHVSPATTWIRYFGGC